MKLLIVAKISKGNDIESIKDFLSVPPSTYKKLFK